MSVVSNTSSLISLARIGRLDLLHQLYGELTIPEAVWHEMIIEGAGQPGAEEVKAAAWIKTRAATNRQLVYALQQELDAGEAEAIVVALEINAELLLMDEHMGYCWRIQLSITPARSSSSGLSARRGLKPPGSLVYQALLRQRDD